MREPWAGSVHYRLPGRPLEELGNQLPREMAIAWPATVDQAQDPAYRPAANLFSRSVGIFGLTVFLQSVRLRGAGGMASGSVVWGTLLKSFPLRLYLVVPGHHAAIDDLD
jgi:hypothetical protein